MARSEIILRSSSVKLKEGLNETAVISWDALDAKITTLSIHNKTISVSNKGQYNVSPKVTTKYSIEAIFPNGEKQIKNIIIEVLPQAIFSYNIDERIDGENVLAELTWSLRKADRLTLNGADVALSGYREYLIDWPQKIEFNYTDAFGLHKKNIHIANRRKSLWIFVDIIKLLLRPFTFIGKVSKKEYWWSLLILVIALMTVILSRALQIDYDHINLSLFNTSYFLDGYKMVSGIVYLLAMLLAKRWKYINTNPWNILFFFPVIIYPLLPLFIKINSSTEDYYSISSLFFGIYALIMFITMLSAGLIDGEESSKYRKIKVW